MAKAYTDTGYTFITGLVRALETKLLKKDFFEKLIKSEAHQGLNLIRSTIYGEYVKSPEDSITEIIDNRRQWLFSFIHDYSLHKELELFPALEYDYHNCKTLLKEKIFDIKLSDNCVDYGTISKEEILLIFKNEDYHSLPYKMPDTIRKAVELYYELKDPVLIDLILDQEMNGHYMHLAQNLKSGLITEYYKSRTDCLNFQIASRLKGVIPEQIKEYLFLKGGFISPDGFLDRIGKPIDGLVTLALHKSMPHMASALKDFSSNKFALERAGDTILKEILTKSQFAIWGVDPLFAYSQSLIIEFKTLKIIYGALQSEADESWIRQRIST